MDHDPVGGRLFSAGDADQEFAIESISKLFVFALVCHALGHDQARRKLGVNSTGLPFSSVMAIELNADRTMNPLVNAGAIATTSLAPGTTAEENSRASSPRCRDSPGGGWSWTRRYMRPSRSPGTCQKHGGSTCSPQLLTPDPMILPHYSYLLAGLLPDAGLKIYPDSAHGFHFQHHSSFAADATVS